MKPRIYKRGGLWYCTSKQCVLGYGLGFTPEEAYNDWLALWPAGVAVPGVGA